MKAKWKIEATAQTWSAWAVGNTSDGARKPAFEARTFRTKKQAEHEAHLVFIWAAYQQGLNGEPLTAMSKAVKA